ncbi:hypothetical protein [Citricoccus nitrophenolicus]|uniref:YVTN family beta-propeller repeat protein n=1 Tax=Citricoccus nitrophenolicus TaxID=863575 RepID=UPI0031F06899
MISLKRQIAVTSLAALITGGLAACSNDRSPEATTATPPSSDGNGVAGAVWVANEESDSLTILDAATNEVVTTLTGVKAPHNVQVGADGFIGYAVSGDDNTTIAIDAETYQVAAVAPSGPSPEHVINSADGTKVYTTNGGNGTVSVYRTPGLEPAGTIRVRGMPHGLRSAADGSIIAVANAETGSVDLIDPATGTKTAAVPVEGNPVQVAVNADGTYAYASIAGPASVLKIDLAAREVVGTVEVSASPAQVYLTPDGQTLLSADQGTETEPGDTLSVIDPTDMTVRGTVRTGSGPHGVVIDSTGTRAWVTNTYDDTVSVIDLVGLSVLETVPVGDMPNGISVSSRSPAEVGESSIALDLPEPSGEATDQADQMEEHAPGDVLTGMRRLFAGSW